MFGNYSQRTGMPGHILVILVWKHCSGLGSSFPWGLSVSRPHPSLTQSFQALTT